MAYVSLATFNQEKRFLTVLYPSNPILLPVVLLRITLRMARDNWLTFSDSTKIPFLPFSINLALSPTLVTTTGNLAAQASSKVIG